MIFWVALGGRKLTKSIANGAWKYTLLSIVTYYRETQGYRIDLVTEY